MRNSSWAIGLTLQHAGVILLSMSTGRPQDTVSFLLHDAPKCAPAPSLYVDRRMKEAFRMDRATFNWLLLNYGQALGKRDTQLRTSIYSSREEALCVS